MQAKSLAKFSPEIIDALQKNNRSFPDSDQWMGRTISCLIKLSWTEEETQLRAQKMVKAVKTVI
ncbi:MAG: hypothetical protein CL613_11020 [Aquimarina sp.]|nr:hypothetical protein [Aquimarina sp.]